MTKKAGVSASRAKIFKGGQQICTKNSSLIGTKKHRAASRLAALFPVCSTEASREGFQH